MRVFCIFLVMFGFWLLLSGKFDAFLLSLGAISCLVVALTTNDLLCRAHQKSPAARLREVLRFIPYCGWLMGQIILANFHVIGLAISTRLMRRDLDPHLFTFKTKLQSDFARFVLANSITLTPGTVTIRIHDDIFLVHAISRQAAGDFTVSETMSEMERRVARVFEGGGK